MQLHNKTKIAGKKTVQDWYNLRNLLTTVNNIESWNKAYDDFFHARLQERYLNAISVINNTGSVTGEGFAIMAILCSLVEFLESTYQGINYKYVRNSNLLAANEYSKSSDIFISFLVNRKPFKDTFNADIAGNFYKEVRCSLLHEARTSGKWVIKEKSKDGRLIEISNSVMKVFRNDFTKAVNDYLLIYKTELFNSPDRKNAFIRKFDALCSE